MKLSDFYYHLPMPYVGTCNLTKLYVMKSTTGKSTTIIVNYESVFKSKEFTEKFIKFYTDPFSTSDSQLFKEIRNELALTNLLTKYGIDTNKLSNEELEQIDHNNQVVLSKLVNTITERSIIRELCENECSNEIGVPS